MVLPPTGLTAIVAAGDLSITAIASRLHVQGCVVRAMNRNPAALHACMAGVLASATARTDVIGPSLTDEVARALVGSGLLNGYGRALALHSPRQIPRRLRLLGWLHRIEARWLG